MPTPTVVTSSPIANETGVSIQKRLSITFSTAIDHSSISSGTLLLYEADGLVPVDGKVTFSTDDTIVYFLPYKELHPSFSYTFVAVGASDSLPAGSIESSTADELATSFSITFRTGTERFVPLSEVTDRTDIEHIAPIRETSELAEVTGYLTIESASPQGFSTLKTPDTITITFDEPIASSSYDASWITLSMSPVLDYGDKYYAGEIDDVLKLKIEDDDVVTDLPTGTISISDDQLIWTKTDGDWPYNAEVKITLSADIEGESGNTLGSEVEIYFTTNMFPMFIGSNIARIEVGTVVKNLNNDTLNRVILSRSVHAWEIAGQEFDLNNPPYAAREYTKWGMIVDVLDQLSLVSELNRGSSKRLGDFEVKFDGRNSSRDAGKYQTALKGITDTEYKLRRWVRSLRMRTAAVGETSPRGPTVFQGIRNWDNLLTSMSTAIPAANWKSQRDLRIAYDNGLNIGGDTPLTRDMISVLYGRFQNGPAGGGFYINRR